MSTAFVRPLPFVPASTSPAPLAGSSTSYLNLDTPGLVWRGSTSSYIIIDLQAAPQYDYVALIGSNLRATDTVQVRTSGSSNTGVGSYAGTALPAFAGSKPDLASSNVIVPLGLRNEPYIRIDLSAPSHPAGFIQFSRLVIGKSTNVQGIQYGAENGYTDRHEITSGPGFESVDEYDILRYWKFKTGWIADADYRATWMPLIAHSAMKRGLLFIPDTDNPASWAADVVYGRLDKSGGKAEYNNAWTLEATITALGQ